MTQGTASVTAETAHMGMSISELRSAGCGVAAECGARVRQLSAVIQRHTADLCGRDALGSEARQVATTYNSPPHIEMQQQLDEDS